MYAWPPTPPITWSKTFKFHHHELMKIVRGEGFIRLLHNLNWFMDYQNCSDVLWTYELKVQKNDIWKYLPPFRLWHVSVTVVIWKVILLILRFVSSVIKFCFYIIMACSYDLNVHNVSTSTQFRPVQFILSWVHSLTECTDEREKNKNNTIGDKLLLNFGCPNWQNYDGNVPYVSVPRSVASKF